MQMKDCKKISRIQKTYPGLKKAYKLIKSQTSKNYQIFIHTLQKIETQKCAQCPKSLGKQ